MRKGSRQLCHHSGKPSWHSHNQNHIHMLCLWRIWGTHTKCSDPSSWYHWHNSNRPFHLGNHHFELCLWETLQCCRNSPLCCCRRKHNLRKHDRRNERLTRWQYSPSIQQRKNQVVHCLQNRCHRDTCRCRGCHLILGFQLLKDRKDRNID